VINQQLQRDFQRITDTVLSNVRMSVEDRYSSQHRMKSPDAAILKDLLVVLEAVRISLVGWGANDQEPAEALAAFLKLNALRREELYLATLTNLKFRMPSTHRSAPFYRHFAAARSVVQALIALEELFVEIADSRVVPNEGISGLLRLVPEQKLGPVQFEIIDNTITIARRRSTPQDTDRTIIELARAQLQRSGEKIISELQQSNCDKRLLASLQELHSQLEGEIDAIKVGLMNIGCEIMCNSFEAELPTAVASMLRSHIRGVQMLVGQFREWVQFVENAAAADLDKTDIADLKAASQTLVRDMKARPELVNPEVPLTISYLAEMLDSPTLAGRRAAFAVLRSLENLVSRVYGYGADFLDKAAQKSIDGASTVASKVVVGMLLLGLTGAIAIGPVASKIPDMNWMKTATEIVKKQLGKLASE
jgi:hypothetical protein